MTSKALRILLDKAIPEEPGWSPGKGPGNPRSDPENGGFESSLGCAESARGAAEAWNYYFRTDRLSLDAEAEATSITDLEDFPR